MSLPEFPANDPALTREHSLNQIISSIAMEELALSHIINAEGEKLQYVLGTLSSSTGPEPTIEQILEINESVRAVLDSATQLQSGLRLKMQNALAAPVMRGPAGPQGPAGPANGLNAFAGIYNKGTARSTDVIANIPTAVPMPLTTASKNTSFTTPNSITITEAGVYYISFNILPVVSQNANMTFAVRSNGIAIDSTESTLDVFADYPVWYMGDTIADLPAGAVIDLVVTSDINLTMNFSSDSNETLTVFKLN